MAFEVSAPTEESEAPAPDPAPLVCSVSVPLLLVPLSVVLVDPLFVLALLEFVLALPPLDEELVSDLPELVVPLVLFWEFMLPVLGVLVDSDVDAPASVPAEFVVSAVASSPPSV